MSYGFSVRERQRSERMKAQARAYREEMARRERAAQIEQIRAEAAEIRRKQQMTIKEHFSLAHTNRNSAATFYLDMVVNPMNEEISKVDSDRDLSDVGRAKKKDEIRAKYRTEALKLAKEMHEYQRSQFAEIEKKAKPLLNKATAKPDDLTVERFKRSLSDLKTDMLLNPNASTQVGKLQAFMAGVSDPYCAELMRDELAGIIAPIAGQIQGEQRGILSREVEGLRERFTTPEVREAQDALEGIASMSKSMLIGPVVLDKMTTTFGNDVARLLNDYEALNATLNPPQPEDGQ